MEPTSPLPPPPPFAMPITASDTPIFHKEKHISYWLRCLRSPLPTAYTSTDAARMMLAFFTVSALDLLGALHTRATADDRDAAVDWIYRCQCPTGGFRGSPAIDIQEHTNDVTSAKWDVPNVPATYFALAALSVLGNDLSLVERKGCLQWLRRLQREDGSFGEMLGPEGEVVGGRDTRFAYCAMAVRWMLRGDLEGEVDGVPDVDVDAMVKCIRMLQTYDGGVSEMPFHEAHAGFTYCAIAALSLIDRLPSPPSSRRSSTTSANAPVPGLPSYDAALHWLVSRLTTYVDEEDFSSDDESQTSTPADSSFSKLQSYPAAEAAPNEARWTGFNGRPNKIADTCYAFWVLGSIQLLDSRPITRPHTPIRRYLLDKVQHMIAGGFGKLPGDPPDIYHSYLGLATVALLEEADAREGQEGRVLGQFDPALCLSRRAREWLEELHQRDRWRG